jgi:uncharacterized protein YjbI with pentapeptide repeats
MTQTRAITVDDLVRGLLAGERDFNGTRLTEGADLSGHKDFAALNEYLEKKADLRNEPVQAEDAEWRGLKARSLFCQSAKLARADLRGAELPGADLRRSDLTQVNFARANLEGAFLTNSRMPGADFTSAAMGFCDMYEANLTGAILKDADLSGSFLLRMSLREADLRGAKLTRADFYRCDLRGAKGLDASVGLETGKFHGTIVTKEDLSMILAAMQESKLFEIRRIDENVGGRPPMPGVTPPGR